VVLGREHEVVRAGVLEELDPRLVVAVLPGMPAMRCTTRLAVKSRRRSLLAPARRREVAHGRRLRRVRTPAAWTEPNSQRMRAVDPPITDVSDRCCDDLRGRECPVDLTYPLKT
jgi:hypothetical protein